MASVHTSACTNPKLWRKRNIAKVNLPGWTEKARKALHAAKRAQPRIK
jgi:hypothetical protein